jgi:asparagine synthase (glutamine-hydrolysing)
MCGICGIIRFDSKPVTEESIRRMMKMQKHRGPDDEGLFIKDNVGLGFVRLSIIDLSPKGHQPMFSEDERYIIVYNGEIYNFIEIREILSSKGYNFNSASDTEVLLNSYIEWGEDCLNLLNGMFSFVIYDSLSKKIFAARDRFGVKPFYYFLDKEKFIFGSEIPAVISAEGIVRLPNNSVIFSYLAYNKTDFDEQTFFKNVFKLLHGHKVRIDLVTNTTLITKWYILKQRIGNPFKNKDEYLELFTDAIRLRLRSDVPVSLSLSGGLDSSSILSVLMQRFNKTDVNTFSAIYGENIECDESEYINLYQEKIPKMFFVYPKAETLFMELDEFVGTQIEPVQSTSIYAQYKIMNLIHQNSIKVVLSGQGADEQLGGYLYFFGYYFKELIRDFKFFTLFSENSHYIRNHKSNIAYKYLLFSSLPLQIQNRLAIAKAKYLDKEFSSSVKAESNKLMNIYSSGDLKDSFLDHFEYKLEHLLKWDDINSMHFSVETRVPFLDYRMVEKTLSMDSNRIINGGTTKYILRQAMHNILPEKIVKRQSKIGFATPEEDWFRNKSFQYIIFSILNSDSFRNRGYINPEVAKILYSQHLNKKINISRDIWKWMNLELWFKKYIDSSS